jgi:hypothetical protein
LANGFAGRFVVDAAIDGDLHPGGSQNESDGVADAARAAGD